MTWKPKLILTCEHGGNLIPRVYHSLFKGADRLLGSHHGWDIGALALAKKLSKNIPAPLHYSQISRLVVDLNRSLGHKGLLSVHTEGLSTREKDLLLENYYVPYRESVEKHISTLIESGSAVLHLSIHSFTPKLNDRHRPCEIGLLYDPNRPTERHVCSQMKRTLKETLPRFRIRLNFPYRGTSDGFTTYLRKRFRSSKYSGIEIEVSQSQLTPAKPIQTTNQIAAAIVASVNAIS